jgi:NADH-quinone oxidoreductase subunit E
MAKRFEDEQAAKADAAAAAAAAAQPAAGAAGQVARSRAAGLRRFPQGSAADGGRQTGESGLRAGRGDGSDSAAAGQGGQTPTGVAPSSPARGRRSQGRAVAGDDRAPPRRCAPERARRRRGRAGRDPDKLATLSKDASARGEGQRRRASAAGLAAARGGVADDLKRIKGIGKVNEGRLNELGVFHFDQIAGWTRDEVRWVGTYLSFPGRIDREDWRRRPRCSPRARRPSSRSAWIKGEVAVLDRRPVRPDKVK